MQSLALAQLFFGLALVQYFLTMLPSLSFGMELNILGHYLLKVCDFFGFDLIGD